jgi:hypothetical protein
MSQVYLSSTSTPSVPTNFTADSGVATPAANNLNVLGDDSTTFNSNGISTDGSGDTLTILLNNRLQGTSTTVGAVTSDILTFTLSATPSVYCIEAKVAAFDSATPSGGCYKLQIAVRTDGATATIIDDDLYPLEDPAMVDADVTAVASGNDIIVRVLGVAGLSVSWSTQAYFERVV